MSIKDVDIIDAGYDARQSSAEGAAASRATSIQETEEHWIRKEENGEVLVRTCGWSPPGDHPVGCGMILHIKDGKLVKVEGDPTHPISQGRLCPRCLALPETVYHPDRVIYPMKRAFEDRGKDKWERITWDEAVDMVESKVKQIWDEGFPEQIVLFTGTGREAVMYAYSMANVVLGTSNWGIALAGNSCYGPRGMASAFAMGAGYPEIDYAAYWPGRYDDPHYQLPEYLIFWGKMPLYSSPDGLFGHALVDLAQRGTKLISVDPRVTWLSTRAEYILQLRPGTDCALALGMINIIIQEDLYDHDFVDCWTYGFDELAARAREYPVEKVEEITGVKAETILAATRAFASAGNSTACWGLALDEQSNGNAAAHAFLCILALTGNYDVPGGITIAPLHGHDSVSLQGDWRAWYSASIKPEQHERTICDDHVKGINYDMYRAGHTGYIPDFVIDAIETGDPYPIRMTWLYGTNIEACPGAESSRWIEGLKTVEFNVCQDIFMTPSAMAYCDLFLPVSTFVEHDGIVIPHFGRNSWFVGSINKAVTVGEAKSDIEINMIFGHRIMPEYWPWYKPQNGHVVDEEALEKAVHEFFTQMTMHEPYSMTFEDFQSVSPIQTGYQYEKYKSGLMRMDGRPGFNTPTGRFEFWRSSYAPYGYDPLPDFEEPPYSPVSTPELAEEYPLVLSTGQRNILFFHSEGRQIPALRSLCPDPTAEINPHTAEKYGIEDGDWMCIENMHGKAVYKAVCMDSIRADCVHATHGWWFPEQDGEAPNYFGVLKHNINELIPNGQVGPQGCGTNYKSTLCKVYRVDGPEYLAEIGYRGMVPTTPAADN
jgi:anaerobic selenocysteine-containing dehydrogenase